MSSLGNWINNNDASVCADQSSFAAWNGWEASQRDLFILNHTGDLVLHQNITSGLPENLEELVIELIAEIPDCDPDLMCGEALTCVDELLYPTTCGPDNCDEPIDTCDDECINGELNNDNPCNPMECFNGQWFEIVIDCAEQMGVPCEGGVYVAPPEGICCSTCVQFGDVNVDDTLNVVDIVQIINIILNNSYNAVADVNQDGSVNVVDVVVIVNILLNGLP